LAAGRCEAGGRMLMMKMKLLLVALSVEG